MDHEGIVGLARRQLGLVTWRQAQAFGATRDRVNALVRGGAWQRERRGVYVVGAAAASWERRVMAACLAAGPSATGSHRTAARLAGLVDRSGPVELSAQSAQPRRLAGVRTHRTECLPDMDLTKIGPIPVTTVARTIVDLAPTQPQATVAGWVDQALREGLLELLELRSCLARLVGPGRGSYVQLEEVIALRRPEDRRAGSVLESEALAALRAAGLPDPVLQHPVRRPDGKVALLDLAYPDHRVGIELDGWAFHKQRASFDHDRERGNDLVLLGWHILHFTATTPPGQLVEAVRCALDRTVGTLGIANQEPPGFRAVGER